MYYAFESRDYLYFIMEYAPGGDCFSLLQQLGALAPEIAKVCSFLDDFNVVDVYS